MLRYARLRVLDSDSSPDGERARVLFHAEIYERGRDRSFLELSLFLRDGGAWRYHSGDNRAVAAGASVLEGMTIASSGLNV